MLILNNIERMRVVGRTRAERIKPRGRDDAGGVSLRRMWSQGNLQPLSSVPAIAEVALRRSDISFSSRRKIRLNQTSVFSLKFRSSLINGTRSLTFQCWNRSKYHDEVQSFDDLAQLDNVTTFFVTTTINRLISN